MKPPVHKPRSVYPALVGAGISLLAGLVCFAMIYQRIQSGEISHERLTALVFISISISGVLIISHNEFTHFWLTPRRKSGKRK